MGDSPNIVLDVILSLATIVVWIGVIVLNLITLYYNIDTGRILRQMERERDGK